MDKIEIHHHQVYRVTRRRSRAWKLRVLFRRLVHWRH
jgi:hypothetical protein